MRHLQPLRSDDGVLFDDFVERSFSYNPIGETYSEPWVGIFHHPPNMPYFTSPAQRHENIFELPIWQESVRHLRLAIALSRYSEQSLAARLSVPTAVVYHPTGSPGLTWSPAAYLANTDKELLQIGWYLRNTRAIHQLPQLEGHRKVRLLVKAHWISGYDERVRTHWELSGKRKEIGFVVDRPYVGHEQYDELLSRNIVFMEVFDASANNVVVECIARNTPLIVNRHPAVVEYLTEDYPLFFDDLADVPQLLDDESILAAHRYLLALDKSCFSGAYFRESIRRLVGSLVSPVN